MDSTQTQIHLLIRWEMLSGAQSKGEKDELEHLIARLDLGRDEPGVATLIGASN